MANEKIIAQKEKEVNELAEKIKAANKARYYEKKKK